MGYLVKDICTALESWAPRGLAYPWDKPGLSVGSKGWPVTSVRVCLTVTREVFEEARRTGANMIVSHHPLIWTPLSSLNPDNPQTRLCLDLVHANIACFSAHTNLDIAQGGVNHALAAALGLTELRPLLSMPHLTQVKLAVFVPETHLTQVRDALCKAGAGVIGAYTFCSFNAPGTGTFLPGEHADPFSGQKGELNEEEERRLEVVLPKARLNDAIAAMRAAHPYEEVAYDVYALENADPYAGIGLRGTLPEPATLDAFALHVKTALGLDYVRVAGDPERKIRSVGVLGGACGEIPSMPRGLQALVSGDIKYHDMLDAQSRGIAMIDAGHAGTERCIVPVLADFLRQRFPETAIAAHEEKEPFRCIR